MKLVYPGPHPAVRVPAAAVVAHRGEPVDIPDDLAPSLIEQGWATVDEPTTPDPEE